MAIADVDTPTAVTAVHAAVLLVKGIGTVLGVSILGAAWAAISPDTVPDPRTVLLVLTLAFLVVWAYRLTVTYLHTYRGHPMTDQTLHSTDRRRLAGAGRRGQYPGRHRA